MWLPAMNISKVHLLVIGRWFGHGDSTQVYDQFAGRSHAWSSLQDILKDRLASPTEYQEMHAYH